MHKKLATDLTSLAHSILQMKNKEDLFALKAKAHEVYEKLALLVYVEEYINNTPNAKVTKEELITKIAEVEERQSTLIETPSQVQEENTENESIESPENSESIPKTEDVFLTENKDREEIPFTINEPISEPFVQENLFSEEIDSTENINENEIIEQPFDELEGILFSNPSIKDEASFIEEVKTEIPNEIDNETVIKEKESLPIINEESTDETVVENIIENEISTDTINEVITEEETLNETTTEDETPTNIQDETTKETILNEIIENETPTDTNELIIEEEILSETVENENSDADTSFEKTKTDITKEEQIVSTEKNKTPTLEEELGDTISVDVMANLFEKAPPKTLNDKLFQDTIKIDLNDRIAFVKNLFEGNQEDFNRVISQLNTIKSEKSAKNFILKMVKPDYDWSMKEAYETRLLEIIERRFN